MCNDKIVVKQCWPFFYRECQNCGLFFRFEVGFKVSRSMFGGKRYQYICNNCAPTLRSAQAVVNSWPGSVWMHLAGYVPKAYISLDSKNDE